MKHKNPNPKIETHITNNKIQHKTNWVNQKITQKGKPRKYIVERDPHLGHLRTPSSASLDSGGFLSTLMPSFSVAIVSALILKLPLPLPLLLLQLGLDEIERDEEGWDPNRVKVRA